MHASTRALHWQDKALTGITSSEAMVLMERTLKMMSIARVSFKVHFTCCFGIPHSGRRASGVPDDRTKAEAVLRLVTLVHAGVSVRELIGGEIPAGQAASPAPAPKPAQKEGGLAEGPAARQGPIVFDLETVDELGTHIPRVVPRPVGLFTGRREAPEFFGNDCKHPRTMRAAAVLRRTPIWRGPGDGQGEVRNDMGF